MIRSIAATERVLCCAPYSYYSDFDYNAQAYIQYKWIRLQSYVQYTNAQSYSFMYMLRYVVHYTTPHTNKQI